MKKVLLAVLLGAVLVGCSETTAEEPKEEPKQEAKEAEKPKEEPKKEEKKDNTELVKYSTTMSRLMGEYAEESGTMGQLLTNAGSDPSLLFDSNWITDMAISITTMDTILDEIEANKPPKGMDSIHGHVMKFVDDARFVTSNLPTALDNMDIELMEQITAKINSGSEHIQAATAEIEKKTEELQ